MPAADPYKPAYTHRLFVIEDSHLAAWSANARFVAEFPFLKGLAAARPAGGCGGCGGRRATGGAAAAAFNAAKQSIAGMGDDRKRRLRELLGAKQLRIVYSDGNGRTIRLTF